MRGLASIVCGGDIYGFPLIIVSDFHIKVSIVLYVVNRMLLLQLQLCLNMCVCVCVCVVNFTCVSG